MSGIRPVRERGSPRQLLAKAATLIDAATEA
jgi:hypothetical protein